MPRFPTIPATVTAIRGSVYNAAAGRRLPDEVFPLHVGDTYLEPALGCRMEDLRVAEHPGMHRYAAPHGLPRLLEQLCERTRARTGVPTDPEDVLITAGGTGALSAVAGALLTPGDEVLILAPHWPLIEGIVRSFHGVPIAVPLLAQSDGVGSAAEAAARVAAACSDRTVALYLGSPNNPTGRLLPPGWLEALVAFASDRGLWLWADEVYEDYVYSGQHQYCRPLAPERTFSVHSFSKAYGMAGNRCGYVIGPRPVMNALRKIATHTFYSTPTASQIAASRALDGPGDAWVATTRVLYQEAGRAAAARLGQPAPEGGTFLFLDLSALLGRPGGDPRAADLGAFLGACAERGVLLAPGTSFGPYPQHARLCFTATTPERTARGVALLAELLAELS